MPAKLATKALEKVRRQVWQELRQLPDKDVARRFKGARWALQKNPPGSLRGVGQQDRHRSPHRADVRHRSDIGHLGRKGVGRRAQRRVGHRVSYTESVRHDPSIDRTEQADDGHRSHHPSLVRRRTGQDVGQPRRRAGQGDGHGGRVSASVRRPVRHIDIRSEAAVRCGRHRPDTWPSVRKRHGQADGPLRSPHVRAHRPAVAGPRRGTPTAAPDSGPCTLST
jgi:hypothetical protein